METKNVESICLADSPAGAIRLEDQAGGEQAPWFPGEPAFAEPPVTGVAQGLASERTVASLPYWEHFLKSRLQSDSET